MRTLIILSLTVVLAFQAGCGQQYPSDWPKTYPCTITVTEGGVPVEGVSVLLSRTENHGSWAVSGLTNTGGVAEIETSWTHSAVKGAPEGTFIVMPSKAGPPFQPSISDADWAAMPYEKRDAFMDAEKAKWLQNNPPLLPEKLAIATSSPIRIEVKPGTPTATLTIEINEHR